MKLCLLTFQILLTLIKLVVELSYTLLEAEAVAVNAFLDISAVVDD